MAPARRMPTPYNVLQEYLQALSDSADAGPTERQQKILLSYAELQYQLRGGGRCSMCNASVRHVLPVIAKHVDGTIAEYRCLCTRCLQAERVVSNRITLTIGRAHLEYTTSRRGPQPRKFRAYA